MSDEENSNPKFFMPTEPPPHAISYSIDGVVQEVIYTHDRFAAINLSEPVIAYATGVHIMVGQTKYDPETGIYTHPDGTTEVAEEFEMKKTF